MKRNLLLVITFLTTITLFSLTNYAYADYYKIPLNQRVQSIFGKDSSDIPKSGATERPFSKCGTLTFLEAKKSPELLSDKNSFFLRRPTDKGDIDYYGDGVTILTYATPEGNFLIHYTEDSSSSHAVSGSDADATTVPTFVVDAGAAFEKSLTSILELGYQPLPTDGSLGGDSKTDVYILDLEGAYGFTAYENTPADAYLAIDNNFSAVPANLDPEGTQKGAIKVTAAHELFHAFQFQLTTDIYDNGWWMEASSTWMESEVYPTVLDYLNYVGSKYDDTNDNGRWDNGEPYYSVDGTLAGNSNRYELWFDLPEFPIDTFDGLHEYGTAVWCLYLSEKYDKATIKNIWARVASGATAVNANFDELSALGDSVSVVMNDFRTKTLTRDLAHGSYYPLVYHEESFTIFPRSVSAKQDHLAARYYALKLDGLSKALELDLSSIKRSVFAVKLLLETDSGKFVELDVSDSSTTVTLPPADSAETYKKATLILLNNSLNRDDEAFNFSAALKDATPMTETETGESSDDSDDYCFIATAAYDGGAGVALIEKLSRFFRWVVVHL